MLLEELEAEAAARGDEDTRVMILGFDLGPLEWFAGRWPRALEHAVAANELAAQIQDFHGRSLMARTKRRSRRISASSSRRAPPRRKGLPLQKRPRTRWFAVRNLGCTRSVELATRRSQAARPPSCAGSPPGSSRVGLDPTNTVWADTIETLVGLGELEQAHAYLEAV